MLLKPEAMATTSSAMMPAATACGNCGIDERRLLHHVRHRGIFRRLCTSCVLRLHPQSFCPTCFAVYNPSPPPFAPNDAVTCLKCYSTSHSSCVGPRPPSPYICPLCITPNTPIFALKKANDSKLSNNSIVSGEEVNNSNCRVIDKRGAKILLAAATIAAESMSKAELASRAEAERRAIEAAQTRKRAREALEHVMFLEVKEKLKNVDPFQASWILQCTPGYVPEKKNCNSNTIGNNSNSSRYNYNRVSNLGVGKVGVGGGGGQERNQGSNAAVNSSNEKLVAELNAVELREKQKSVGLKLQSSVLAGPSRKNGVEDNRAMRVGSSSSLGNSGSQNRSGRNLNERSGNSAHLQIQNSQREKVSNGALRHLQKEDQMQGVEVSHAGGLQSRLSNL